ncbi:MAG: hypothetical protein ACI4J5_00840 [Oscillospiraceae bacterium]
MKGLIYRELYIAKKSYITGFLVTLAIMIVGILVRLSAIYGNLAKLDEDSYRVMDIYTYNIFMYLPLITSLCTIMSDHGVIIGDSHCRFGLFAYTLPLSEIQLAAVKYIILIGSAVASVVPGIINAAIICGIGGKALSAGIMKNILIITAVCILVFSIGIPLLTGLRVKTAMDALSIGLMGIVVLVLWLNMDRLRAWFSQYADENGNIIDMELLMKDVTEIVSGMRDIAAQIAPFVIIISLAAGFAATVILYKRRVK